MSTFTCKAIVFEGKSHPKPKRPEYLKNNRNGSSVKKCLFGAANPEETDRMLKEQIKLEKIRFEERFGFNMEDVEQLEKENESVKLVVLSERNVNRKKKRTFEPPSSRIKQLCLTDYFKAKKTCANDRNKDVDNLSSNHRLQGGNMAFS